MYVFTQFSECASTYCKLNGNTKMIRNNASSQNSQHSKQGNKALTNSRMTMNTKDKNYVSGTHKKVKLSP
jgi:hypothetical protein